MFSLQHRRFIISLRHAQYLKNTTIVIDKMIKQPFISIIGNAGFKCNSSVYSTDLVIYQRNRIEYTEQDSILPFPPEFFIEIMTLYNYTYEGETELNKKIGDCFKKGTRVVWLIHPGIQKITPFPLGVEILTKHSHSYRIPHGFLKDDDILKEDNGIFIEHIKANMLLIPPYDHYHK